MSSAPAPLFTKYRPTSFEDVLGQAAAVKSLKKLVAERRTHAFLFTGPSGTGKTTLARIVLRALGATDSQSLREVDAATFTGIDDMRAVIAPLSYAPIGDATARGLIIDEAHALSKAAWQSLLKSIEEPPPHVFWAICTTEPGKVPKTIQTRCAGFDLKEVKGDAIFELLVRVATAEKFPVSDEVLSLVADSCGGSPRQALVFLDQVSGMTDPKEAAPLIRQIAEADEPVLKLCRALNSGGMNWSGAMALLGPLIDENPGACEGVRIQVQSYFAKVARGSKGVDAQNALAILEAFSTPYPPTPNAAPLLLSIGRLLLSSQ